MMAVLLLLTSLLVSVCFRECACAVTIKKECFIGNNVGSDGTDCGPAYLATPGDPCSCSSVRLGGVNVLKDGQKLGLPTAVPVKEIVISENVTEIREALACEPCQGPLGMSDGFIPDENIHISYTEDIDFGPERARPIPADNGRPWCAGEPGTDGEDVWIQVKLANITVVSGVRMIAMPDWPAPVMYQVRYKLHNRAMCMFHECKSFDWSTDAMYFERPLITDLIRLYPARSAAEGDVCMQFELLGCRDGQDYLGMADGSIPDSAINASSVHYDSKPAYGRLNYNNKGESMYSGGWCAHESDSHPWISVDLGSEYIVTGVITQGASCDSCEFWVSHFSVEYSCINDTDDALKSTGELYSGNTNRNTAVTNVFKLPVLARYLRILPQKWHGMPCLRFELLGWQECSSNLGMEDGTIDDEQITASSSKIIKRNPVGELRLGTPRTEEAHVYQSELPWVTVDLGMPTVVSGVTLFCLTCLTPYTLDYTMEPMMWSRLLDEDSNPLILNAYDSDAAEPVFFHKAVYARFIRITGTSFTLLPTFPQFELWGCKGRCEDRLGMEDGGIPDSALMASSFLPSPDGTPVITGRFNDRFAWSPETSDTSPWFQVSLGSATVVSGLITQGKGSVTQIQQWVKTFRVYFDNLDEGTGSVTNIAMHDVADVSGLKQFTGNLDENASVRNSFREPVLARVLRIVPLTWHGGISMRVELLGCRKYCQQKLGVENGQILDQQLTSSESSWNRETHGAQRARLNQPADPERGLAGGWVPGASQYEGSWLNVDFAQRTNVTGIITQGRQDKSQWVTRFQVRYHQNYWNYVRTPQNGEIHNFNGNYDGQHEVRNYFPHQVTARSIRVYPTSWKGAPSMRLELLGCTVRCQSQLGMEDGTIPDSAISASGSLAENFNPDHFRLSHGLMYYPLLADDSSWIQVNFDEVTEVSGIIIQMRREFILGEVYGLNLKYTELNTGRDSIIWQTIRTGHNSEVNIYQAPSYDESDRFQMFFDHSIFAHAIRLYPSPLNGTAFTGLYFVPEFDFIGCLNNPRKVRTCWTLMADGYWLDGMYELDVDGFDHGEPPFEAYCSFSSGYTEIDHDSETITPMEHTTSYNISYSTSIQQIINVINNSSSCIQYVSASCGRISDPLASMPVKWMSRSGVLMSNWGVETGTTGCSCGTSNSCRIKDELCNCAGLMTTDAVDSGPLTDKDTLPVTGIAVSSDDISSICIGPLICYW